MVIITQKELREREENDHYPTPVELVRKMTGLLDPEFYPWWVLDPGAGTGVYGEQVKQRWPGANVVGIEIDPNFTPNPAYKDWIKNDIRAFKEQSKYLPGAFDLAIGNPPYGQTNGIKDRKLAEDIVRTCWQYVRWGGYIVFLLRLGFLAGQRRADNFWPKHPLKDFYVLNRRPSFTGNQKTDEHDYGVFVWQKGFNVPTYLKWLIWDYDE